MKPLSHPAPHSTDRGATAHSQSKGARLLSRAVSFDDRMVTKRDGQQVRFDLNKITRAIALANTPAEAAHIRRHLDSHLADADAK